MASLHSSAAGAAACAAGYAHLLRHWPVPSEQLTIPTRQGPTFVVAGGPATAPPVLALHGSGGTSAMWMGDVPDWSRHFRVYAVDLIGEPGGSAPVRPPLRSPAHAGWLDDVLDGLGLDRVAIVAASLGGWLALDYAIRRPGRVTALALLSPSGIGRQKVSVLLAALLLAPLGERGTRATLRYALGTALPAATPVERAFVDHALLVARHFRPRRERIPRFPAAGLRGLRMPTLVVLGGRDRMLDSRRTRRRLEREAPGAEVHFLPQAGHLVLGQTGPVRDFLLAALPRGRSQPDGRPAPDG